MAMEWTGRQLVDAGGSLIGVITGAGFERKKFGTGWLVVETAAGRLLVPADQIDASGEQLVLPYPRGYVVTGPALQGDEPPGAEGERRLRLHYGIGGENGGQCRSCGLCMTTRRAKHRQKTG